MARERERERKRGRERVSFVSFCFGSTSGIIIDAFNTLVVKIVLTTRSSNRQGRLSLLLSPSLSFSLSLLSLSLSLSLSHFLSLSLTFSLFLVPLLCREAVESSSVGLALSERLGQVEWSAVEVQQLGQIGNKGKATLCLSSFTRYFVTGGGHSKLSNAAAWF